MKATAGSSKRLGAGAQGQVPDRHQHARGCGTCPTSREPSTSESSPAACSRARARRAAAPRRRAASPSAGAPWCRRRSSTPRRPRPSRRGRVGRCVGSLQRRGDGPVGSSTSATQKSKPSCTVTSRGASTSRSWRRLPSAGALGEADDLTRLGVERLLQDGPEVAARVAERVLHLQAEPDRAVLARPARARPRAAASRARRRGRRPVERHRRGRGGRRSRASRSGRPRRARPANGRATYAGAGPAALPWQAL